MEGRRESVTSFVNDPLRYDVYPDLRLARLHGLWQPPWAHDDESVGGRGNSTSYSYVSVHPSGPGRPAPRRASLTRYACLKCLSLTCVWQKTTRSSVPVPFDQSHGKGYGTAQGPQKMPVSEVRKSRPLVRVDLDE